MKRSFFTLLILAFSAVSAMAQGCPTPTSAEASVTFKRRVVGLLEGEFSVSSTKKVQFAQGNLQYTISTGKWSLMAHQYDMVETLNQNVGTNYASQDVISLFGWGTSGWDNNSSAARIAYQPYATSSTNSDYGVVSSRAESETLTGDYANADWGVYNSDDLGSTDWRTLTGDEWYYLLTTRSASTVNGTSNARYAKVKLFGTIGGIIIFPDDYVHPDGVDNFEGINNGYTDWDNNEYDATDWSKLAEAGCVFLPAAGYRDGTTAKNVNGYGLYWSSSASSTTNAYGLDFKKASLGAKSSRDRYFGYAVRLVQDVE